MSSAFSFYFFAGRPPTSSDPATVTCCSSRCKLVVYCGLKLQAVEKQEVASPKEQRHLSVSHFLLLLLLLLPFLLLTAKQRLRQNKPHAYQRIMRPSPRLVALMHTQTRTHSRLFTPPPCPISFFSHSLVSTAPAPFPPPVPCLQLPLFARTACLSSCLEMKELINLI